MIRARKITAAIFATISILLTGMVVYYWNDMGCGWESLLAAVAFYGSASFAIWYTVDQTIKEANE